MWGIGELCNITCKHTVIAGDVMQTKQYILIWLLEKLNQSIIFFPKLASSSNIKCSQELETYQETCETTRQFPRILF